MMTLADGIGERVEFSYTPADMHGRSHFFGGAVLNKPILHFKMTKISRTIKQGIITKVRLHAYEVAKNILLDKMQFINNRMIFLHLIFLI